MTASCCFNLFGKIWDWRIKKTKISAQKRTGAKNPKSNDCRFKEYTTTKERKRIGAPPWLKEHTDARWHFKLQSSAVRSTFNTFSKFFGNAFGTEYKWGDFINSITAQWLATSDQGSRFRDFYDARGCLELISNIFFQIEWVDFKMPSLGELGVLAVLGVAVGLWGLWAGRGQVGTFSDLLYLAEDK